MTSSTAVLPVRGTRSSGPRCGICATTISPAHHHLFDASQRSLVCGCPGCHDELARHDEPAQHGRLAQHDRLARHDKSDLSGLSSVPDRYLEFPAEVLTQETWDDLRVPAGLAFLTRSGTGLVVSGPAPTGATEEQLPPPIWDRLLNRHPVFATLRPDVEALFLRRAGCFLIPVDACYDLAALLRTSWRGFTSTPEATGSLAMFMARLRARCQPAAPGAESFSW
ncbi:hypothetical protein ACTI_83260 [Actinoplanes sp. OR16]|uniref:DUF5947 family protein n=1 Tax=Actinoplanes sp. OR16 TaxID=946334 RepID=UPI000F6B9CFA|nr:DUF5947 family protein [Actinoplanes sp. OR16]BBH71641.1 hypothetical protein ACTI_83260 [Actinoplanes sp. OR16]